MYDVTLTRSVITTMYVAPVVCLLMGAWAFSNQQIFQNHVNELDPNNVYPLTNHYFRQFFYQVTPGTLLIITTFLFLLFAIF